jgi:hypothetical protein
MSRTYEAAAVKATKRRRRCTCGCKALATHVGGNNAIALMSGCELSVRRWVRDGYRKGVDA